MTLIIELSDDEKATLEIVLKMAYAQFDALGNVGCTLCDSNYNSVDRNDVFDLADKFGIDV